MKLADARQEYYTFSGKASDVARQLGFAGIAIIWIFNQGTGSSVVIPPSLVWAGLFLVIGLSSDFLQYVSGTIVWGYFHRSKERKGVAETAEFLAPRQINWPTITFFILKLTFISLGYIVLISFLISRLA